MTTHEWRSSSPPGASSASAAEGSGVSASRRGWRLPRAINLGGRAFVTSNEGRRSSAVGIVAASGNTGRASRLRGARRPGADLVASRMVLRSCISSESSSKRAVVFEEVPESGASVGAGADADGFRGRLMGSRVLEISRAGLAFSAIVFRSEDVSDVSAVKSSSASAPAGSSISLCARARLVGRASGSTSSLVGTEVVGPA